MTINSLVAQYHLQTTWFLNALENISDEESNTAFTENTNPIKWVAGHLTDARITILSIVSDNAMNTDFKQWFGKGTGKVIDETFPNIEQIKTKWVAVSETLMRALRNMTDDKLQSKPPFQTSIPDETLQGLIAYFALHESFHLGQISVYRKLIGKVAMSMGRK